MMYVMCTVIMCGEMETEGSNFVNTKRTQCLIKLELPFTIHSMHVSFTFETNANLNE